MSVLPPTFTQPTLPSRQSHPRFESFQRMLKQRNEHSAHEVLPLIERAFPDAKERKAYFDWARSNRPQYRTANHEPVPSPSDYIEKLLATRYTNLTELHHLYDCTALRHSPVIVIGRSRNILYKVLLSNRLKPKAGPGENHREILPDNLLGINDNVEPNLKKTLRQRRNQNYSEESTESADSDDYIRNAFHVFHQIGALMYYDSSFDFDKEPEKVMEDSQKWRDTGFAVVSNVTSGRAEGVWLVFDFYPFDESSTETYHVDTDLDWGWLPNHEGEEDETDEQFSSAKIADSLNDLGPYYKFKLEHKLLHEPELVRVVKTEQGQLLRQTVNNENPGRRVVS